MIAVLPVGLSANITTRACALSEASHDGSWEIFHQGVGFFF